MGWKIVADGTSGCLKEREKQKLLFSAGPNYLKEKLKLLYPKAKCLLIEENGDL